jgi:hypothetical protein
MSYTAIPAAKFSYASSPHRRTTLSHCPPEYRRPTKPSGAGSALTKAMTSARSPSCGARSPSWSPLHWTNGTRRRHVPPPQERPCPSWSVRKWSPKMRRGGRTFTATKERITLAKGKRREARRMRRQCEEWWAREGERGRLGGGRWERGGREPRKVRSALRDPPLYGPMYLDNYIPIQVVHLYFSSTILDPGIQGRCGVCGTSD